MFARIRQVALLAVIGLVALGITPRTADAQLSPALQAQVQAAINSPNGGALVTALMQNNPGAAAAISTAVAAQNPAIVQQLAGVVAQVIANSNLSAADKAAQLQAAGRGLAQANPNAAGTILAAMVAQAPGLSAEAAAGIVEGAPGQADVVTTQLAQLAPQAGPATPPPPPLPPTIAPPPSESSIVNNS